MRQYPLGWTASKTATHGNGRMKRHTAFVGLGMAAGLAGVVMLAAAQAGGSGAAAPRRAEAGQGDVQRGFQRALDVCEECHVVADGRNRRDPPAPGAPSFFDLVKRREVTAFYLRAFFRTPHRDMPDLILTRGERDDLIAYILSLRPRK